MAEDNNSVPGSPGQSIEGDEERTSRGKETARDKGLVWSKQVPKEKEYEYILRDDSHMMQQEVGFLPIGEAEPTHAYDVGGQWKLLYKKPGEDDKPIGPGIKPRGKTSSSISPKASGPKKVVYIPPPPMKIFVRCWDGQVFPLENVKRENSIDDIQDRIESEYSIPRKHQRLRYGSRSLTNPCETLQECEIQDKETLDLDPMKVYVREPNSPLRHPLTVDPSDTVDDLKAKVFLETAIPKDNQKLAFDGQPLDRDRNSLEDYGIEHEDTIDLEPMRITIRDAAGRTVDLVVDPDDTIDEIKDRIEKSLGIPTEHQNPVFNDNPLPENSTLRSNGIRDGDTIDLDPMEIHVNDPIGRVITFNVDPYDTIGDVKNEVKRHLGIPTKHQRPTFNDELLLDNSTLKDNGINHGDTIHLQPMEIKVKDPTGHTINLVVSPDDTVKEIKKQVKKILGIPTKDQRPTFNDEPLPDTSTLRDIGIQHGDTINLQPMMITVRDPLGRTLDLGVDPDHSIKEIKNHVEEILGIPVEDQRPIFNGEPLSDDSTLKENEIEHGDVIDLKPKPMEIRIRSPDGKSMSLPVDPDDEINDIKDKIDKGLGIPVADQHLSFNGALLPDRSTFRDNGIEDGDIIKLEPMKIYVIDLNGDKHTYEVTPSDTIQSIKNSVDEDTGMPAEDQRLSFNDSILDQDDETLDDIGIQHRDTLQLEPFKIHLRLPGGKRITVDVNPFTVTPDGLKDMVENRENIDPKSQTLSLKGTKLLDPNIPLYEYGVKHEDLIDVRVQNKVPTPKSSPVKKEDMADPDRYGKVTRTTYQISYDGDYGDPLIAGIIKQDVETFKMTKPLLRSEKAN